MGGKTQIAAKKMHFLPRHKNVRMTGQIIRHRGRPAFRRAHDKKVRLWLRNTGRARLVFAIGFHGWISWLSYSTVLGWATAFAEHSGGLVMKVRFFARQTSEFLLGGFRQQGFHRSQQRGDVQGLFK